LMGEREKGMCAMLALIDAIIAKAEVAFVTVVALPVTSYGKRLARIAKHALFQPVLGIIFAHEHMWRCQRLCQRCQRRPVPMPSQHMRLFVARRITALGTIALIACPGGPSESKPVFASFTGSIAAMTQIKGPVIALRAVIVKLVFYMLFAAMLARDLWFGV